MKSQDFNERLNDRRVQPGRGTGWPKRRLLRKRKGGCRDQSLQDKKPPGPGKPTGEKDKTSGGGGNPGTFQVQLEDKSTDEKNAVKKEAATSTHRTWRHGRARRPNFLRGTTNRWKVTVPLAEKENRTSSSGESRKVCQRKRAKVV